MICAITGKPLSEVLAVIKDNREHFARDLERHRCDPALVQLPDLSGLEFVSQLRSRGSQVPTIMITATTDLALERRAAELGIKQVLQTAFVEPSVASGRSQRNGVGSPTSWPVARRSPDYNHGVGMVLIEFDADQFIEIGTNYAGSAGDQPPNYPIARRDPGFPRPG